MASESQLRYLKLDYQSHKDAILSRVRSRWPLVWNDFLSNSVGTMLVDLIAWSSATLAYVINRRASENYVSTMTMRESAIRLGSLVGYKLRSPTSAAVKCEAFISAPIDKTVTIAEGTIVRTGVSSTELVFEVDRDYSIFAGFTTPREDIVYFSPLGGALNMIQSSVTLTNGSTYADLSDSSIDLKEWVEAGQTFFKYMEDGSELSETEAAEYTIESVEAAPNAISNNRMVLSTPWQGETGAVSARVIDTRISVVHGQTIVERTTSPSVETDNFVVQLSQSTVVDGTVTVNVNGEDWEYIDIRNNFTSVYTQPADAHVFEVRTLPNGTTVVLFGDGKFGARVPVDAAITVSYRTGGGTVGNVTTNTIATSVIGTAESTQDPVSVAIVNQTGSGVGGQDSETLEEARSNIPAFTRTNNRAVTLKDYATIAQSFSSTAGQVRFCRASVRTGNSLLEGNVVVLYAWTSGTSGGLVPLNSALKQDLKNFMQAKCVGTDYVVVSDGNARPAPIALRFKTSDGFDPVDTEGLVRDTVTQTINNLVPGEPVLYSNLVRDLDSVYGVDTVNMATPVSDLIPNNDSEIFTRTDDDYRYSIIFTSSGGLNYRAQLPFFPLTAWCVRCFFGSREALVLPDTEPGYARIFDPIVVDYREGLSSEIPAAAQNSGAYYYAKDSNSLYLSNGTAWVVQPAGTAYKSRINLLTGQINLSTAGTVGNFYIGIKAVQGYSRERPVNLYIGYLGSDTSITKRREIRSAIRSWSEQFSIAGSLFSREISGIQASRSNVTDVVRVVSTITSVTRVALDTPGNASERIDAVDFEVIKIGSIYINGLSD
jgi:hypothetical protein